MLTLVPGRSALSQPEISHFHVRWGQGRHSRVVRSQLSGAIGLSPTFAIQARLNQLQDRIPLEIQELWKHLTNKGYADNFVHKGTTRVAPT